MHHSAVIALLAIALSAFAPFAAGQDEPEAPQEAETTRVEPADAEEEPASAPAETPDPEATDEGEELQRLDVRVTSVKGMVQVRPEEGDDWQPAKVGMKLGEGAEFRTGPRSEVKFIIEPDHHVTLDRFGTMKVLQAVRRADKVKTDLGMKYGRAQYEVEAAGVEHESRIHSPGATLAVRGSEVLLQNDAAGPPRAVVFESKLALFSNWQGDTVTMQQGTVTNEDPTPGEHSRRRTVTPQSNTGESRSDDEVALREAAPLIEGDRLRQLNLDGDSLRQEIRRRASLRIAEENVLPGRLNFLLSWAGASDVDLTVISPDNEVLTTFPTSANGGSIQVPSGGRVTADHLGPNGLEIGFWGNTFPEGTYQVKADLFSGDRTEVQLRSVLDGATLQSHRDTLSPIDRSTSTTVNVVDPRVTDRQTLD